MAMRAAAVAVVKPRGLRRLFCTQTFVPSRSPPVEPSTQLLVTDLSKRTTSDRLKEAFSKFGVVVDARVVTDRLSGYSKGYGFVRYETIEEAAAGIKGMDGQFLDGWVVFCRVRKTRTTTWPSSPV
ncbi:organelle RRM domain-containing protein 2, mitochondrial-like isoform X2 [Cornus florida]|uniref:organelle RRM domain-containing protein 2, mitochondrial-like isoform X2 n=1 Tax=Cornus florida TaxID=4283 RepID=UPI00289BCC87|nr:organelle RRM domain-containing protein 2, mitochondrial-like isoform X2 [Cornus florida]